MGALVQGLSKLGFEPIVIASTGDPTTRYDSTAARFRAGAKSVKLGRAYRALVPWLEVPDEHVVDLPQILWAGSDVRPDLVLASSPPYSMLLAGTLLAKRHGCPFVADFRDPWIDYPYLAAPTPIHRFLHQTLEWRLVTSASAVLCATERMTTAMARRARPDLKVRSFFNGYDPELFVHSYSPTPGKITVGFYGSIYDPIDPEPLVRAVVKAGARLEHAGDDFDGTLARAVKKYGAELSSLGFVTQAESVERMQRADVLAVVLPDDPVYGYWRTQKLPEYLASGRPVLGLLPEGEARELIERYDAGISVSPEDADGAARAISALAQRREARPMPEDLTWSYQIARVAELLRSLL